MEKKFDLIDLLIWLIVVSPGRLLALGHVGARPECERGHQDDTAGDPDDRPKKQLAGSIIAPSSSHEAAQGRWTGLPKVIAASRASSCRMWPSSRRFGYRRSSRC
jgi:hypothetical protein